MSIVNEFFFFKQKTSYDMRISYWSSDVCSSDLTRGVALVEDIDLSLGVTSELERDQAQENRLAGAGRPHDHHMADITDMGGKPERGRAFGLRDQERRSVCLGDLCEMLVAGWPRPDCGERHQVREFASVHQWLPPVGIDVARQRREPCFEHRKRFGWGK